ncbi:protoporphyrin IX magnesium-chelatase [Roseinatronobacter thiooxidans]|uniref:Protoporphyrin IX magnesium-chelatase n=1 Tax=Roseinatronobacter thiooxidans TaxID=121821 RepID=A0A2W7R4E9_9RHOB|nr:protoporphyrin IX magnesium-chelatase [Roseinatronobacter thiooxidans]
MWLRGRAGPVRDHVLAGLAVLAPRKLHPYTSDEALMGGMDLSATLATGEMHRHAGLLEHAGCLMLTMAERCPPGLAVRLGQALDSDPRLSLVALDEAAEDGEGLPNALADRLGLFLDIDGFAWSDTADLALNPALIATAQTRLRHIAKGTALDRLTRVAAELAIPSLRAPLLALACARAHAAWRGGAQIEEQDLQVAVALVMAHKALAFPEDAPQPDDTPPPPEPPQDQPDQGRDRDQSEMDIPDEILIEAARAALPPGLLAKLQAARVARQAASANSGAGAKRKSMRRGRPMPSRAGKPGSGARVDVIATLRQAAPWQKMRRAMMPGRAVDRLLLMPSDIRIKRYQEQTDRVLIFVVDASGSAALARLAEAKGAVELMLAEAYSSRDHVALVTFRGHAAELSLPPTRSLVQTKRRLAGLPGGGATPLADALQVALSTAEQARRHGMTPTLAMLTDGRGNIALDGSANRVQAGLDATRLAKIIAAKAIPALVIDTSLRPKPQLAELSAQMGATLIALPRADARSLSATLSAALGG